MGVHAITLKTIMVKYKPLFAMMQTDSNSIQVIKV